MYDKNGCQIFIEDFSHLQNDDCIYVYPKRKDFNYKMLLDMYTRVSPKQFYIKQVEKLGEGGFGKVYLLKHKLNNHHLAAKFVNVSEFLNKANNIQKALKEAR